MCRTKTAKRRRRKLVFRSLEEIYNDAEAIFFADQVEQLGNWSLGKIAEHLAKSFRSSICESRARLPFAQRVVARMGKPLFLRLGLPSGVRIESSSEVLSREFLPRDCVADREGLVLLRDVINELKVIPMTAQHNLFGNMTPCDWMRMHCRHAELHLSFLVPDYCDA